MIEAEKLLQAVKSDELDIRISVPGKWMYYGNGMWVVRKGVRRPFVDCETEDITEALKTLTRET